MAQGYKDFTAGSILTAADLEDYNQNQSIMRFASAAARDAALTTVKTEGMLAYLIDVNTLTVYNGSVWSTIGPVHGAALAWTPAVVQSGAVASTTNLASYFRVGRMITAWFVVTCTGAGTASNLVTVSLPVAADAAYASDYLDIGSGILADVTATGNPAFITLASSTTMKFRNSFNSTAIPPLFLGAAAPFSAALASGDIIAGRISYPAGADA